MEGCSEPQLDAKAKVTNQVSEWPSLAASAGLGWTSGGRLHLVLRPPLAAAGRCHREPSPAQPQTKAHVREPVPFLPPPCIAPSTWLLS
ncbi:COMM domain-containing protein 6 isoform X1 [Orcinus orca]|uniref:COMM domain-containing protein 6 isoform X2 n=1 Tax=Delphinapterus leucas TaxID=9749 RepID=A0A2Y9NF95_DELLE|nr:COMM domain-containing protein 6 isoform X2 [Delphinapterus leucas]XP_049556960.1 COMM domain-containing protein 6 isoform X1 [Orcinus orca]